MNFSFDIKRIKFYLWVTLGFFLLTLVTTFAKYPGNFFPVLFNNSWLVMYVLALNYLLFEYVVQFVLQKRRMLIYNFLLGILLLCVFSLLYSYGAHAWNMLGKELHIYSQLVTYKTLNHELEKQMAFSVGSVFIFGIARHIFNYVKLKQAEQRLLIEKQEAELNYLKSQTNPHFLFNTLNNIYSLSRDKSDLAPEAILRLSKILRFMLYETGGEYISIESELKIIADYIELEKLRYDDSLQVNFNHDIEDMKQAIPPLLLIPLVENAFKHGVSETRGTPFVDIYLLLNQRQLELTVKNSTELYTGEKTVKESIGLSNLRRQLELLYKSYSLDIKQGDANFTAVLKINLASHV